MRRVVDHGSVGPAIVLVHGTPLDLTFWDPLVACLGDRRTIRYDVRGHGSASEVPVAPMATLVDDLITLIKRLELDEVHLVGHSWGGQIVQRALCDYPGAAARATLLCTRASPFPAFADLATGLRAGTADREASLARWFSPRELADDTAAVQQVRAWLRDARPQNWAAALDIIAEFDVLDRLSGVDIPVDVVAAEYDGVGAPEHMAKIADALPCSTWHVIDGARHLVPLQRPEAIARILPSGVGVHVENDAIGL